MRGGSPQLITIDYKWGEGVLKKPNLDYVIYEQPPLPRGKPKCNQLFMTGVAKVNFFSAFKVTNSQLLVSLLLVTQEEGLMSGSLYIEMVLILLSHPGGRALVVHCSTLTYSNCS